MAVSIPIDIRRRFRVKASPEEAHRLLANVPDSASHFPKVAHLEDLGGNRYRWEMERVGTEAVGIQVVYACEYRADPQKGSVSWTPVAGVGNGQIRGSWQIRATDGGSEIELSTSGEISLPLPRLMSAVAKPIVAGQFADLVDSYIRNLSRTLGAV